MSVYQIAHKMNDRVAEYYEFVNGIAVARYERQNGTHAVAVFSPMEDGSTDITQLPVSDKPMHEAFRMIVEQGREAGW